MFTLSEYEATTRLFEGGTTMHAHTKTTRPPTGNRQRLQKLLARTRRKQLELAIEGRVTESARFASRAQRITGRGMVCAA